MSTAVPAGDPGVGPLPRTRLYAQVAEQITGWIRSAGLSAGDRLPPERELAQRLGVSRATLSQALVALEVVGVVTVRHGDGTVVTERPAAGRTVEAVRAHADRLGEVIDTRDALESKLAALAAQRHTEGDLARIDAALEQMAADVEAGGRGLAGDEAFHGAVTAAAHSALLARLMGEISGLIKETRVESLSQPGRPQDSLAGHRAITAAIRDRDPDAATAAMHAHVELVSDVALTRDDPR
ncbi:GntR family transcriptional regulator [Marmoricola endophyticus]|uniref:GntR family transcriptional regulator n=1 Tax=Marmoricola endophyticus TaxID=2040280 RepID=A0A917F6C0_9ACTN|nr:FadR/GntR family transcriptional regulator [Marmoricola endophyticus]GGF52147.1 GntR family transcriptional regulator [Marmoricola endophyticus]